MSSGGLATPAGRLRERRAEIEGAILDRVLAVSGPRQVPDQSYAEGLRNAVCVGVEYGLAAVERSDGGFYPPPPVLRAQARLAARNDVSLEIVLRRYFAAQAVLIDFIVEEVVRRDGPAASQVQRILRSQAAAFDRLIVAVADEHGREDRSGNMSSLGRVSERVRRLLAGEPLDARELRYDIDGRHIGLVGTGSAVAPAIRAVAKSVDGSLLIVPHDDGRVWAWLGGRRSLSSAEVLDGVASHLPAEGRLAIGEPGEGKRGWRLTHRQAMAALPIAVRGPQPAVRYADVALFASVVQDDLLTEFLRDSYLKPLEAAPDGGEPLYETLRAYFAADGNTSSAAARMGISRNTVASRLRRVEQLLDGSMSRHAFELAAAIRLPDFVAPAVRVQSAQTMPTE